MWVWLFQLAPSYLTPWGISSKGRLNCLQCGLKAGYMFVFVFNPVLCWWKVSLLKSNLSCAWNSAVWSLWDFLSTYNGPPRNIDSQQRRNPAVGCTCMPGQKVFYGCAEKTTPSLKSCCFVWQGESSGFRGDSSRFGGRLRPSYESVVTEVNNKSNQGLLERKESGTWICSSGQLLP